MWVRMTGSAVVRIGFAALVAGALLMVVAFFAGYRPVVITSGSMGEAAPTGSVIIAATTDRVEVGDVLVMRRDTSATITHRIVEIEQQGGVRYAITQGDANDVRDAEPYRLGDTELVARWTIPHVGSAFAEMNEPAVRFAIVAIAIIILAGIALGRIWFGPHASASPAERTRPLGP